MLCTSESLDPYSHIRDSRWTFSILNKFRSLAAGFRFSKSLGFNHRFIWYVFSTFVTFTFSFSASALVYQLYGFSAIHRDLNARYRTRDLFLIKIKPGRQRFVKNTKYVTDKSFPLILTVSPQCSDYITTHNWFILLWVPNISDILISYSTNFQI